MIADDLLALVTKAIDRRRREIDHDLGLRQLKIVLRRANGRVNGGVVEWVVQVERTSEDPPTER